MVPLAARGPGILRAAPGAGLRRGVVVERWLALESRGLSCDGRGLGNSGEQDNQDVAIVDFKIEESVQYMGGQGSGSAMRYDR